jgi:hypothetical protein
MPPIHPTPARALPPAAAQREEDRVPMLRRREALAAAGRRRAADFTWDAVCAEYERAYALARARWQERRG